MDKFLLCLSSIEIISPSHTDLQSVVESESPILVMQHCDVARGQEIHPFLHVRVHVFVISENDSIAFRAERYKLQKSMSD